MSWERVDALENRVAELQAAQRDLMRRFGELSDAHSQQSRLLGALLEKLGESADTLPGEQPTERTARAGRKAN